MGKMDEFNTPIGGVELKYKDIRDNKNFSSMINQKIKVFISSICGVEKYDKVRAELKRSIEDTKLAEVYIFEGEGASTLPAGCHYSWALEDSDICIFLIDNKDGITHGVQKEIDIVRKYKIMALYYFCDEQEKKETVLQQSLMGARFAKSKTVHNFNELGMNGATELINDIIFVYHHYCKGRLSIKEQEDSDIAQTSVIVDPIDSYSIGVPKTYLKNVDKSRNYILEKCVGFSRMKYPDETEKTSEMDDWCVQFLPVVFEGKSIKEFNTNLFFNVLRERQTNLYFQIVEMRWMAIQEYYNDNLERCIEHLNEALKKAKEYSQPDWVIKDILIDLRNLHWILCEKNNQFSNSEAQKEIDNSNEELYYPMMDRLDGTLYQKYIEKMFIKKIESPYTITLGNNLDRYCEYMAGLVVISMYNGSLTHILLLHDKIRDFLFFLCSRYDDWKFKCNLYKFTIYCANEKHINGVKNSYPEILNRLTANEAKEIIGFCEKNPIRYKRKIRLFLAFGAVGYYLDDEHFEKYNKYIINEIKNWINDENAVFSIGNSIFSCLNNISYRMSQDVLSEICCMIIDKKYTKWYIDVFKLISHINIEKVSEKNEKALILHIIDILKNDEERHWVNYYPMVLTVLRKQSDLYNKELDELAYKYLPKSYKIRYRLYTEQQNEEELIDLVQGCVKSIDISNEEQGKNGIFIEYGKLEFVAIRSIILMERIELDSELLSKIINSAVNNILIAQDCISNKLEALSLLLSIFIRYPSAYIQNYSEYNRIYENENMIEISGFNGLQSNINGVSLKIGLQFLYTAMEKDSYAEILQLMPLIQNDIATTIAVVKLIAEYLEISGTVILPQKIESVILQNTIQWLNSENLNIRCYATRILFTMLRNSENQGVVNRQLVKLVDSDCAYIKNIILRRIYTTDGILEPTRDYIVSKCKNDENFAVRLVYKEETEKQNK